MFDKFFDSGLWSPTNISQKFQFKVLERLKNFRISYVHLLKPNCEMSVNQIFRVVHESQGLW